MVSNNHIYSVKEVAKMLGVTPSYIYYLIAVGKIKTDRLGWQYVITQGEIDQYRNAPGGQANV